MSWFLALEDAGPNYQFRVKNRSQTKLLLVNEADLLGSAYWLGVELRNISEHAGWLRNHSFINKVVHAFEINKMCRVNNVGGFFMASLVSLSLLFFRLLLSLQLERISWTESVSSLSSRLGLDKSLLLTVRIFLLQSLIWRGQDLWYSTFST